MNQIDANEKKKDDIVSVPQTKIKRRVGTFSKSNHSNLIFSDFKQPI
jgi:hypothetical protein